MEYTYTVDPKATYIASKAIVKGVVAGIKDLFNTIAHPIDNIIMPVSELVYDSTIMLLHHQHLKSPKTKSLYTSMMEKNPDIHKDASGRMQRRIDEVKSNMKGFANAPIEKQVEALSTGATTVFVPGALINGARRVTNLRKYGIANPPVFHAPSVDISASVKTFTPKTLKELSGFNDMIYVYTIDNELLISHVYQGSLGKGGTQIFHPHLAKLRPVYAAGEAIVNGGKIIELTNFSGHYMPTGMHLPTMVANAFEKAGFTEVNKSIFQNFYYNIEPPFGSIGMNTEVGIALQTTTASKTNEKQPKQEKYHEHEYYQVHKDMRDVLDDMEEIFDDKEVLGVSLNQVKEYTNATPRTAQAYKDLALCAQEFHLAPEKDIKLRLAEISKTFSEVGELGCNLSTLALATGGHKRTWNGVAKVSGSLLSVSSSITSIISAKGIFSLGALTGGIGLALGAIGIINGLFGGGDDDGGLGEALQSLGNAIAAVHQAVIDMHNNMIQCFNRMEEILVVSIVGKLSELAKGIDRLEKITLIGFRELHIKDLIDITDYISKDVKGEHTLTNLEKNQYLRQLSSWIDNHSKSTIQTQALQMIGSKSPAKLCSIVEDLSINSYISLFVVILSSLVPNLKTEAYPNIDVLLAACEIYMVASRRDGYEANTETIRRALSVVESYNSTVEAIRNYEYCCVNLIGLLHKQYMKYRMWSGQMIFKAKGSANWSNTNTSLLSVLGEGSNMENLMEMLDNMELRRVCIAKLCELQCSTMEHLESKNAILSTSASKYCLPIPPCASEPVLRKLLENGSDPNCWDGWGQPIHYITRDMKREDSPNCLNTIFSIHPSVQVNMTNDARYDRGETYAGGVSPQLYAVNAGKFCDVILMVANGHDTNEFCKLAAFIKVMHTHRPQSNISEIKLIYDIVISMRQTQRLHAHRLQKAYAYHKAAAAGMPKEEAEIEGFPTFSCGTLGYALFVLACITGDLFPLRCYIGQWPNSELELNAILFLNGDKQGLNTTIGDFAIWCGHKSICNLFNLTANNFTNEAKELGIIPMVRQDPTTLLLKRKEINPWLDSLKQFIYTAKEFIKADFTKPMASATASPKSAPTPVQPHVEEAVLFRDLIADIIQTIPTNKHLGSIKRALSLLNDSIDKGDSKLICRHFNTLNALLISIKEINYTLADEIRNLIKDLSS
jgi:hypothetical protein